MKSKYEYGYWPKVDYWLGEMAVATTQVEMEKCKEKVLYFLQRQKEVYGF